MLEREQGRRLYRRAWPIGFSAVTLAVAFGFWFGWGPLVMHRSLWITPGDIWATYRSAHFIGWGDLGGVYSAGTRLVAFPECFVPGYRAPGRPVLPPVSR
jgi:hypothetical protein